MLEPCPAFPASEPQPAFSSSWKVFLLPPDLWQLFPVPLTDGNPPQPLPGHPHSASILTLIDAWKHQLPHENVGSGRAGTESVPSAV